MRCTCACTLALPRRGCTEAWSDDSGREGGGQAAARGPETTSSPKFPHRGALLEGLAGREVEVARHLRRRTAPVTRDREALPVLMQLRFLLLSRPTVCPRPLRNMRNFPHGRSGVEAFHCCCSNAGRGNVFWFFHDTGSEFKCKVQVPLPCVPLSSSHLMDLGSGRHLVHS